MSGQDKIGETNVFYEICAPLMTMLCPPADRSMSEQQQS